ncbi:MAG: outer membrane beta-barrel protein [Flavobacteriales bacterium]
MSWQQARNCTGHPGAERGRGTNTCLEVGDQQLTKGVRLNVNGNLYQNAIDAFSTVSAYPVPTPYTAERQRTTSGNVKVNARSEVRKGLDVQLTGIWQARDIVPQGSIGPRWSVDLGVVRKFRGLRSDLTIAATDLFNTYRIPKVVVGDGFKLVSTDYLESRAVRVTWAWTF